MHIRTFQLCNVCHVCTSVHNLTTGIHPCRAFVGVLPWTRKKPVTKNILCSNLHEQLMKQ